MAQVLLSLPFALFGTLMFLFGYLASSYVTLMLLKGTVRTSRRRARTASSQTVTSDNGVASDNGVTRDDIRAELLRDAFATELMCNDDTPDDVARYLYLEAERRARLRKQGVAVENENDLFSKPHDNPE